MEKITGTICSIRLGLPGSGKSLGMVEEDILPHLIAGREVWVNFWINWKGSNIHFFKDFDEIANLRNCVVAFDEIGQVLEPRQWEQEGSEVRRFFQLHRHHHIDIYGTTQDISLVAKTALIVVDEWILCNKVEEGKLAQKILKWLNKERIRIEYENMSYQQLKKLSNGWEIFDNIEMDDKRRTASYQIKELIHQELDEHKIELTHEYCKICESRQEGIEKEGKKVCPKHQEQETEIKKSGMYDTDYDIEIPDKPIKVKYFIPSPKGWRDIEYKGALNSKQLEERKRLEDVMA